MNRLYVKNLAIEITRRCNMSCAHCLRGDAQSLDISHRDIRNILKHIKYISKLTITGGEPSLNPKAMRYLLKQLKHFDIPVYCFYIVTNGSKSSISREFIDVCLQLAEYQEEDADEGNSIVEVSDDKFHDDRHRDKVLAVLGKYPAFAVRGQSENIFLFKEGRCTEGFENTIYPLYLNEHDYVYGNVYLNAEGNILSNGDLSYGRQSENVLCNSGSFMKYLKTTLRRDD